MRGTHRSSLGLVIVALLLLGIAGCGTKGPEGEWYRVYRFDNDVSMTKLSLQGDGTVVRSDYDDAEGSDLSSDEKGTWELQGDVVSTVYPQEDGYSMDFVYGEDASGQETLTRSTDYITLTFYRSKSIANQNAADTDAAIDAINEDYLND